MNYKAIMAINVHEAGGEYFESIPVFYKISKRSGTDLYFKITHFDWHVEGTTWVGGTFDVTAVDDPGEDHYFQIDPYGYLYVIDQETCDHSFRITQNADVVEHLCKTCGKRTPVAIYTDKPALADLVAFAESHDQAICMQDVDGKFVIVATAEDRKWLEDFGWGFVSEVTPGEGMLLAMAPLPGRCITLPPNSEKQGDEFFVSPLPEIDYRSIQKITGLPKELFSRLRMNWQASYSAYDPDTDTELIVEYSDLEKHWVFNVAVHAIDNPDERRIKHRSDPIYRSPDLAQVAAEQWLASDESKVG